MTCLCDYSMGVTAEMLRPFLEGWTLKQIIDAKRLFLVDLKILEKIHTIENRPVSCTQKSFFVVNSQLFELSAYITKTFRGLAAACEFVSYKNYY
jgi:hypothetical protein